MINKTGALLYLRQPFAYSGRYFTYGTCGVGFAAKNNSFSSPSQYYMNTASRSLDSNNYKATISKSFTTGTTVFFNAIETPHGGIKLNSIQ